jgi:hypothetical protein
MKRVFLTLMMCLLVLSMAAQSTFKTNLVVQKTAPSLWFKGATGTLTFGAVPDMYITHATGSLTVSGGILKISTDTVATNAYARAHGSGSTSMSYPDAGIPLSTGAAWGTSITNNSAHWELAYTDRLKWDGGSTGLVAGTARTSLGATTVGASLFMLTNPSAITFLRVNADNSISALSSVNFKAALSLDNVTNESKATMFTNSTFTGTHTIPSPFVVGATSVTTTGTQLNYLNTATGNIQTQLNDTITGNTIFVKLSPDTLHITNARTLVVTDAGKEIHGYKSTSIIITIPLNSTAAIPVNSNINFTQFGTGNFVFKKETGVNLTSKSDSIATKGVGGKGSWVGLKKVGTNHWALYGDLAD